MQRQMTNPAHHLLQSIRQVSDKLSHCLEITWIPSHVGIPGNEFADKLAALGLDKPSVDITLLAELKDLHKQVDKYIYSLAQTDWNNDDIDIFCSNITQGIYKAARESIPIITHRSAVKRMSRIWCEDLKNAVHMRNSAQHRWQRSRSLQDLMAHKHQKTITQRLIRLKTKESWVNQKQKRAQKQATYGESSVVW